MFIKCRRNLVTFLSTSCNVSTEFFESRFMTLYLHFPDNSALGRSFNSFRAASTNKGSAHIAPVSEGAKLYRAAGAQITMSALANVLTGTGATHPAPAANWYALYTAPRHEKLVANQISRQGIDCFLPLYRSVRRWKDRRKQLSMVLFPGYVFVQMAMESRLLVLQVPGAVRLVSFNGRPAVLPDHEIETVRMHVSKARMVEPHAYLSAGQRVRVASGPLQGLEGIIVRTKDRCRVVLSIHLIMRSVAVEVDADDLEFIG